MGPRVKGPTTLEELITRIRRAEERLLPTFKTDFAEMALSRFTGDWMADVRGVRSGWIPELFDSEAVHATYRRRLSYFLDQLDALGAIAQRPKFRAYEFGSIAIDALERAFRDAASEHAQGNYRGFGSESGNVFVRSLAFYFRGAQIWPYAPPSELAQDYRSFLQEHYDFRALRRAINRDDAAARPAPDQPASRKMKRRRGGSGTPSTPAPRGSAPPATPAPRGQSGASAAPMVVVPPSVSVSGAGVAALSISSAAMVYPGGAGMVGVPRPMLGGATMMGAGTVRPMM
jgi:hypothetical protein